MNDAIDCATCLELADRVARERKAATCSECGAALTWEDWTGAQQAPAVILGTVRFGSPSAPPLPTLERIRWQWTPSVAEDMTALAKFPAIRAWDPERDRAAPADDPDVLAPTDRDRGREIDRRRAAHARARLAEMARPTRWVERPEDDAHPKKWRELVDSPDGSRFAAVVWYAYGERGEILGARESAAVQVAKRYGTETERRAHRAWYDHAHRGVAQKTRDATAPIAYGNALIGAATAAYADDAWSPVVPAVVVPEPKAATAKERFAARVASAWADARAKWMPEGG